MVKTPLFNYSRVVFVMFGLWCDEQHTRTFRFRIIRFLVCIITGSFVPVFATSDVIATGMSGDSMFAVVRSLFLFAYLTCFHKLASAAYLIEEIQGCIRKLSEISEGFQDQHEMTVRLRTYWQMSVGGAVAFNLCALFFIGAPARIRQFPYNPHLIILDFTQTPYYEVTLAYEVFAVFVVANSMLAYDTVWRENSNILSFKDVIIQYGIVVLVGYVIPIITASDAIDAGVSGNAMSALIKTLYGSAYVVYAHKLSAVTFNSKHIQSAISKFEILSTTLRDTSQIKNSLKTYRRMTTFGLIATNFCGAFFLLAPMATRELPYNPHFPYIDFTKSPKYEFMYLYQAAVVLIIANVAMAYDTLFCGLMSLCGGLFASIKAEVANLDITENNPTHAEKSMTEIIRKLIETSKLITKISDTFSMTTMTSICYNCSLMALGLFMVSFLPFSDLTCIAMLLVIIVEAFQLWIYCYFGQTIVNEKELLQVELYCTNWYNGSPSFKSMLLLTLFEAQNNRFVRAGRLLPLSLETFTAVLKKAYAFYAFLNETR